VITEVNDAGESVTEATVKIEAGGNVEHTARRRQRSGECARRRAAQGARKVYPELREVTLVDYKVRVCNPKEATGAKVLVLITSSINKSR